MQGGWIKAQTIESGRIAAQQYVRGEGRLYIRIFPAQVDHVPSAGNPHGYGQRRAGALGGRGQGGTVLFELGGVTEQQAKLCFARLAHKMPVRVRMVRRRPA